MLKLPEKNKRLLLHACCAPCVAHLIQSLKEQGIEFTVFFYNPNIFPHKEYELRKNELIRYCKKTKTPLIIAGSDLHKEQWESAIKGHELDPERGTRCHHCIEHRLEKTARYAFQNGFDLIATALSGSRWKDSVMVGDCGNTSVKEYKGVNYWDIDWNKVIDVKLAKKISQEEEFYRQKYCGCFYSIGEHVK